ncbi:hypothetical protein ACWIGI_28715 [Nocardia sp. NPDC055321]
MEHNIDLIRRVCEHIGRHPADLDQSKWRTCVAGIAVELHGGYQFWFNSELGDAAQVINKDGYPEDVEDVAARLLGMWPEEAAGLFASDNRNAVAWLEDILAAHRSRVLDQSADLVQAGS